jgi:hypothetical protein
MAATKDVTVKTVDLELRTVRLTKSVLKQIPELGFEQIKPLLRADGNLQDGKVVGWVHGSVLGDDFKRWLIVRTGEGEYGRFDAMQSTVKAFPQIYVV